MPERTNRRDLIILTAAQHFEEHGYAATSTREIAEAVGCTEAALYYHFRGGKREILETVMAAKLPEIHTVLETCREATSLRQAMLRFGASVAARSSEMRWMLTELPHLTGEERTSVHATFRKLQEGLAAVFDAFLDDAALAKNLAWMVVCMGIGYRQLFWDPDFAAQVGLKPQDLIVALTEVMS